MPGPLHRLPPRREEKEDLPEPERKLTPVEVCKCGSSEVEEVTQEWANGGVNLLVMFECGTCINAWMIEYTMTGIREL